MSTCVNRYGPPPATLDALRCIKPVDLLMHPYDAAERLREVYATMLGIDAGDERCVRGAEGRILRRHEGKADVVRANRLAIVPASAWIQVKGDRQRIA